MTVVYDGDCGFCRWCRDWLAQQELLVPVTLRPSTDPVALARWGQLPGYGEELLVADDRGRVWVGPDAFAMAAWTTARLRPHARLLTGPTARAALHRLSARRDVLGHLVGAPCEGGACRSDATTPAPHGSGPGPGRDDAHAPQG